MMLVACAGYAAAPHALPRPIPRRPNKGPIWVEFADGSVPSGRRSPAGRDRCRRQLIHLPQLRALGAKTVYFDLNLRLRVGTRSSRSPRTGDQPANRLYSTAAMSSGCTRPVIAENEMNGANLVAPWTANNAAYRRNVLIYMQTLSALGAHPVVLVPSGPCTGDKAGDWWRQLSQYAEVVREVVLRCAVDRAKQGLIPGSRTLRNMFRQARGRVHFGHPAGEQARPDARLQTTPGWGGRAGTAQCSWLEVDEAAGARREAGRARGGVALSVWSWGWAAAGATANATRTSR